MQSVKTITVSKSDLMWLAGLIEGDGCFHLTKSGRPIIFIEMTDKDVIDRVGNLWDSLVYVNKPEKSHYKPSYRSSVFNNKAKAFMIALKPYMSSRRQSKIAEIIQTCNENYKPKRSINCLETIEKIKLENKTISCRRLAPRYGVSHETIRWIVRGKHLDESQKKIGQECAVCIEDSAEDYTIDWLAGVLEAEGSFMRGPPSELNSTRISIQMSDKDTIDKISLLWGVTVTAYTPKGQNKLGGSFKEIYMCVLRGAKARNWMETLNPYMGIRRQEQITTALNSYNSNAKEEYYSKSRKISDESLQDVFDKLSSGLSYQAVAEEYGVTRNVIRRCLQRYQKTIDTQNK